MLDCSLCQMQKKLPERLVHSLTVWAVDLNPISSVPMVRGQGILRQWGDKRKTLGELLFCTVQNIGLVVSCHPGMVVSEGPQWEQQDVIIIMQVCHAVNSCDKQGGGRAFGKQSCQQSEKFICPSCVFLFCGQAA